MANKTGKRPVRRYNGISATERVAARRNKLIDAGLELFGTQGFASTGVKELCRHAGLTDRYFYESFRDSSELFVAVFDRVAGELFNTVMRAVGAARPDPESQVRAAIENYVRALAEDPRKGRVIFIEPVAAGARADQHARASLRQLASAVSMVGSAHLPPDLPEYALQMGGLSMVGAIERVMTEWHDGHLKTTVEEVSEFLVVLFLMVGAGFGVVPAPNVGRSHPAPQGRRRSPQP
jgi:AcrR family transcriptional regulator